VLDAVNDTLAYRRLFGASFPAVAAGAPIPANVPSGRPLPRFQGCAQSQ